MFNKIFDILNLSNVQDNGDKVSLTKENLEKKKKLIGLSLFYGNSNFQVVN